MVGENRRDIRRRGREERMGGRCFRCRACALTSFILFVRPELSAVARQTKTAGPKATNLREEVVKRAVECIALELCCWLRWANWRISREE